MVDKKHQNSQFIIFLAVISTITLFFVVSMKMTTGITYLCGILKSQEAVNSASNASKVLNPDLKRFEKFLCKYNDFIWI